MAKIWFGGNNAQQINALAAGRLRKISHISSDVRATQQPQIGKRT